MRRTALLIALTIAYIGLLAAAIITGNGWQSVAITYVGLVGVWYARDWLGLTTTALGVAAIPFILQSIGDIWLYDWNSGLIGYDWIMHFTSAAAAAYVLFAFHTHKMRVKERGAARRTLHVISVISIVMLLGVVIELFEFGSYVAFGETDSFLGGPGNPDFIHGFDDGRYGDTGFDLMNNLLGATTGAILYLSIQGLRKRKRYPTRTRA